MPSRLCRTPTFASLLIYCLACVSTGCGSTVATSTGPSPAKCSVTLTPPSSITAAGAAATIAVSTQPECTWNASAEASWITGVTPASGQGAGEVHVTVGANPSASPRQGDVLVNGTRAQIRQDAAACQFTVSPSGQNVGASGGSTRISVDTLAGCAWTSKSDESWVTVSSGSSGTGPGSVTLAVSANKGGDRSASVTIAGRSVTITQDSSSAPTVPPTTPPILPPTDPSCTFSVTPLDVSVDASAASRSVSVSGTAGCDWSAGSNASWISISGSSSGSGSGTLAFSIASNTGGARGGTLTVAGQTVTVSQAAAVAGACSFTVNPTTASIGADGGTGGPISVDTTPGCTWSATSSTSWLSVTSGGGGSGPGSVSFTATANTGAERTGTLLVAGSSITVTQAAAVSSACSYGVTPTTVSVPASGITNSSINVSTTKECGWTATANDGWISVTGGASGSGNGKVMFSVAANTSTATRSGTLTVAGQSVSITQAAAPSCAFTVSPTSASFSLVGGTGSVSVTTTSGCSWTASSGAGWISIVTGSSGSASGTVTYAVLANTGSARSGTLSIAGQTVTISQDAAPVCAYVVTPTSFDVGAKKSDHKVSVTTTPGCTWTASSNVSWITIKDGASGSGGGSTTFTVADNGGDVRSGTLTVAGQTVTVSQKMK